MAATEDAVLAPSSVAERCAKLRCAELYSRSVKAYYEARAPEYDDWWNGAGLFADRDRPGFVEERAAVIDVLEQLNAARTLDAACGTGFITRHLPGDITGVDQSPTSLRIAAGRLPEAELVEADVPPLPFADRSFERVFSSHFYGHLEEPERLTFVDEARRVAPELVLLDASIGHSPVAVEWQPRVLNDGSRWEVYKRFFASDGLLEELGGGETLFVGRWFVVVRSP